MYRVKLDRVEEINTTHCAVHMRPFINIEPSYMIFPMSKAKFESLYRHWLDSDMLIQQVFSELDTDCREFLLSGLTPEQWDTLMSESLSDESN
jgi:hypothetical protein